MTSKERFFRLVNKSTYCWNWKGFIDGKGYGICQRNRRRWLAHRLSWELNCGEIPEGIFVLHKCDNPKCVRPDHLFLGTQLDNMRDKKNKGRQYRAIGEKHHNSKLTLKQVTEIRQFYRVRPSSFKELADKFHVSPACIWSIIKNKTWVNADGQG